MFTTLDTHKLWYDGTIEVGNMIDVERLIMKGIPPGSIAVSETNDNINRYNRFATPGNRICVKEKNNQLDLKWTIPESYLTLDVLDRILTSERAQPGDDIQRWRIAQEYDLYQRYDLINVLRTLCYIIDTFKQHDIVWGVGRGSSVASYVLYLLEVHDIDSIAYDLNIHDFLKAK